MDEWLDVDPRLLTDEELEQRMRESQSLRIRLDAAELATMSEWDKRMAWAADGARSGGAWLAGHLGMAGSTARERLRVGREVEHMPATGAAFETGEITYSKVRVLANARNERTTPQFADAEETLVGWARALGTDAFSRLVKHWMSVVDPDGASADAAERWTRRGASMAETDGTGHLKAQFDPESNAVFAAELDSLMSDAAAADRRDTRETGVPGRSAQQRRLDCLVEMARRSAACNTGVAPRSRPEMIVMVDYQTYLAGTGTAEMAREGLIPGEAMRRLACEAGIVRSVVAGKSEILDLGRSTPIPNAAQRRAAALRWTGCVWPGCDVPFNWTQLHHVVPYRRGHPVGGETNDHDLAPVCAHHHHLVHEQHFILDRDVDTDRDTIELRRRDNQLIARVHPDGPITRRRELVTV